MAGNARRAAAAMGVDLALDRMDVVDGGEVEVLAPDIRCQLGEEGGADGAIARHGVRLDHGGALPVLADALVIELGRLHRHGKRGRTGVGAQAQVGAEDVAVDRALRHELDQHPGGAHEMARHLVVAGKGGRIAVVEQDEVDVARVVELARTKLAHAEDGEGRGRGIVGYRQLPVALELQEYGVGQRVEAARGKGAERAGDLVERPHPCDIGNGDGECLLALEPAQARGDRVGPGPVAGHAARRHQFAVEAGGNGIRAVAPQIGHKSRVL